MGWIFFSQLFKEAKMTPLQFNHKFEKQYEAASSEPFTTKSNLMGPCMSGASTKTRTFAVTHQPPTGVALAGGPTTPGSMAQRGPLPPHIYPSSFLLPDQA